MRFKDIAMGIPVLNANITRKMMREIRNQGQEDIKPKLTERELEILKMVALGKPYKIIAQEFSLRQATIRAHVSNILSSLMLPTRSQLVLYAIHQKIISSENSGDC